ncbi:MAG: GNAT family N-acetyltransferase [Pyrinomonadaceae bacterium]
MSIEIRNITEAALETIFELMKEFAAFEDISAYLEIKRENYVSAMFGPNAFVDGLIAFDGDEALGYAIFYPNFATFRSLPGIYLEDLFVSERARGKGVGEMLLREVARNARQRGFERIDFLVLDWNTPAINFYKKHGAETNVDDRHFKFTDKAFSRLAE